MRIMPEELIIAKDRHRDDLVRAEGVRLSLLSPRPAPWLSRHLRLSLGRLGKNMVNIEVRCPQCDDFYSCKYRGKFTVTIEEDRLYTSSPYARCPTTGRKIYLNRPYMYKVLKKKVHEEIDKFESS